MVKPKRVHAKTNKKRIQKDREVRYILHKSLERRQVTREVAVTYAYIRIEELKDKERRYIFHESIPTRANLYNLLDGLYFFKMKEHNKGMKITEEDVSIIRMFFTFRRHYSHWQQGLKVLNEKGTKETKKWLIEKAQMLGLLKAMMPEKDVEKW